jgi:hypothetical protein
MSREYEFKDATKPLTIHADYEDFPGAIPGSARNCVLARAGRREHGLFDMHIFRTVAYVRWREATIPVRYQVTASVRDTIIAFDAAGRKYPITITLTPPRKAITRPYQQTFRRKQATRAKGKRRAELRLQARKKVGRSGVKARPRRAYTKPDPLTLLGVRNGTGKRPPRRSRL